MHAIFGFQASPFSGCLKAQPQQNLQRKQHFGKAQTCILTTAPKGNTVSLTQTELADLAANLFDSYDEGFEGDTPLTDDIIVRAEAELGYKLPADYTALMRLKNGGSLKRRFFRYADEDGAQCGLMVRGLYGIGFANTFALKIL